MSNVLQKLTEGIVSRNVAKEGQALLNKWSATGLLEGLDEEHKKQSMACLLENQAKELLREANSMASGAAEGFASVAFPIVRRVFGGLLANDIVSVQPMSLPSGLIFFLDFTYGDAVGQDADGESLHGGGKVAKGIADGVSLTGDDGNKGLYNLNAGYSAAQGTSQVAIGKMKTVIASFDLDGSLSDEQKLYLQNDADLLNESGLGAAGADRKCAVVTIVDLDNSSSTTTFTAAVSGGQRQDIAQFMRDATTSVDVAFAAGKVVRRLTTATYNADGSVETLTFVVAGALSDAWDSGGTLGAEVKDKVNDAVLEMTYAIDDNFTAATALGGVVGATAWALEDADMPEIDIKVDSIAITAQTRKLKAKWTPELGQDLNAYHNLDAEVELTSILSEQIALEIDKEILNDLLNGASGSTRRWSKLPGQSADADGGSGGVTFDFTGNISEWYETLVETINDASADIHRKTLRGGANFIVCGPEAANILEFTSGFRASVTHDADRGTVGAVKEGALNKKWDIYVDPYFPRNAILVGRKGSSFLESGYVYAPYVPLQTTPTVFDPTNLTPRKGVMTRYGKKMVRPDMYAVVLIHDM